MTEKEMIQKNMMVADMGQALNKSPDNDDLQKLKDIFQSMLEDGN